MHQCFPLQWQVDLRHIDQKGEDNNIELGMDLQEYYISTEWDVMRANAIRNEKFYPCCAEPFQDIHFYLGRVDQCNIIFSH